ncbi:MAG: acyltransferase [Streptomycetaceae bacterium]|nr:MAG: acyltransferase [Streptomycetaceae bacterium]
MRVLQIQGLRALAALLVTFFHAQIIGGGYVGVDIFYVISGYLITGLILREIDQTGKMNLSAFYQRRIKRLLPSSAFVLFSTAIVGWVILPETTRDALGRDLFAAAAYISNYLFAWWQNDYQNLNATPSPFIHYWSLAVEEQFYLLWPFFMLLLAKYGKQIIIRGILALTVLSFLLSVYQTQTSPIWAFYSLPTRAWELGVGALLLFIPERLLHLRLLPWFGIGALVYSAFQFSEKTSFPGVNALVPVLGTAILIAAISTWPPILNDLFNNSFSQWLGRISYPLYLWHWPALVLPSSALGRPLHMYERAMCIVLTVALAHLTNRFIEEPMRHKKFAPRTVYIGALSTTVLSLLTGILIATSVASVISTRGTTSYSFDLKTVMSKPAIYDDGCPVNSGETKSGPCTYGDVNSKVIIVLYGDSHAAQWFPTLQKISLEQHFRLISLTKSSCPSVDVNRSDQGAYKNLDCADWRKNSVSRIKSLHPAAVIMSGYQHYAVPHGVGSRQEWWENGQIRLLMSLMGSTSHLIYISDTPKPVKDIPSCLASRDLSTCDTSKKSPAILMSGFETIDPTKWLCTTYCPAILDGIVAYRDASHISVSMALHLLPSLEAALRDVGLFR